MESDIEKRITERLAALKLAREQIVNEVNQRLAPYNAVIAELEQILAPEKAEEKPKEAQEKP